MDIQAGLTATDLAAKRAEREAREIAQLEQLQADLGRLIAIRKKAKGSLDKRLLWAEFDFFKSLDDWGQSDDTAEWFSDACRELGVDKNGDSGEGENWGAAHPDNPSYSRICAGMPGVGA